MGKTADQIFDTVVGLCFWTDEDKPEYKDQFIRVINLIISECFDANNSLRRRRGKEELAEIPTIKDLTTVIGFEDKFENIVIPYGVASIIYVEDDEAGLANIYRAKYEESKNENSVAHFVAAAEDEEETW